MPGAPFTTSALGIDLSARIAASTAVVASPQAGAETIIASVAVPGGLSYASGVIVVAFAAFTVGTDGVSANLRIRQTSVSGTIKSATGATNTGALAATQLTELVAWGFDTAPGDGQLYKATLEVGSGSAPSTVSAVFIGVFAV